MAGHQTFKHGCLKLKTVPWTWASCGWRDFQLIVKLSSFTAHKKIQPWYFSDIVQLMEWQEKNKCWFIWDREFEKIRKANGSQLSSNLKKKEEGSGCGTTEEHMLGTLPGTMPCSINIFLIVCQSSTCTKLLIRCCYTLATFFMKIARVLSGKVVG